MGYLHIIKHFLFFLFKQINCWQKLHLPILMTYSLIFGKKKKFSKIFLLSVSSKTSPLLSRFEIWFCSTDTLFVWKIWACVGLRWQSTNYWKGKKICRNKNLGGIKKKGGEERKYWRSQEKKFHEFCTSPGRSMPDHTHQEMKQRRFLIVR